MKVFRIVALATVLLATAGVSSASATLWRTYTLPQSIWFSGGTNFDGRVVQAGGFGFPGGKYAPIASTLRFTPYGAAGSLRPLPSARFGDAVVTGQDGFVYAIGGMNASNALLGSTVRLDATSTANNWAGRAALPIPRVALSATVASNGLIYTLGGDRAVSGGKTAASAVVEIYNPTTNVWTTGPGLPIALDDTAAATSGTEIYVFGGFSPGSGPSAHAYSLDTSNPGAQWVEIPNMPSAHDLPGAAMDPSSANGDIYVAGGAIGSTDLRRVDVYDPVQNLWRCLHSMPGARVGAPTVIIHAPGPESLVISGGLNGNLVENTAYYAETGLDGSDHTPPVVSAPPVPHIVTGVQATTTRFETALSWTRADGRTDVLSDNLQDSVDAGQNWTDVTGPWATLDPGYFEWGNIARLAYRVSPTDCNNNTATPVAGPQFGTHIYSEGSLHYTGTWANDILSSAQGGHYRASSQTGAVATFKFTGRDIGWLAVKGPSRGLAYVSVDGVRVATVNLYAKALEPREVVWHRAYGSFGTHTLAIRVVGTKGHPSVDVDSLFVIGKPPATAGAAAHAVSTAHLADYTRASAGPAKRVARP